MSEARLVPSIFDELSEEEERRLDDEAEAQIEATGGVPHEEVVRWLMSWGTPNELPCPVPKKR